MLRSFGPYIPRRPQKLNGPLMAMLLNGLHDHHAGRVFVLHIGAGTGEGSIPLLDRFRDAGWSGLLVEPYPDHFAALEALHADSDRVAVLNLGVSDTAATLALHSASPGALARNPRLPHGRATLIRERLGLTDAADITSVDIPVLRLDAVLEELGLGTADLVVINAGGHEEQVLRSFDLGALAPKLALVQAAPGTLVESATAEAFSQAGLLVFRIGDWLAGLAPGALFVPLEELLSFFNRGIDQSADPATATETEE